MSELYIKKLTPPSDVAGHKPGLLPDSLLSKVDGGKLHWLCANAWKALKAQAKADGIELKPTSAGDLYRTYDSQLRVFLERYQKEPKEGASTRTFQGVKWYKKSEKLASLAAPGTSQHNSGLAVDVHTASGERLKWMIANCAKYGFSWEVVPEEPWHIRYTEGNDVPEAVKAWMAANPSEVCVANQASAPAVPVSAPAAEPTPETISASQPAPVVVTAAVTVQANGPVMRGKANAASNPVLKLGSEGSAVKTLQQLLVKAGVQCATDGKFGPKTEQAVKNFQSKVGIEQTGVVNNKTWMKINP